MHGDPYIAEISVDAHAIHKAVLSIALGKGGTRAATQSVIFTMHIGHKKVKQFCNFTDKGDSDRAQNDRAQVKPEQCEKTVFEVVFNLQNPKSAGCHANILPHVVQNQIGPKIVHNG